jgi:hypothetical protein
MKALNEEILPLVGHRRKPVLSRQTANVLQH